jgi:hypothetical protein
MLYGMVGLGRAYALGLLELHIIEVLDLIAEPSHTLNHLLDVVTNTSLVLLQMR